MKNNSELIGDLKSMNTQKTAALIAVYSILLLILGTLHCIVADFSFDLEVVICFLIGVVSLGMSYFMIRRAGWSFWAGMTLSFGMMLFMGWRSTIALRKFIDMLQNDKLSNPYDHGTIFLIVFTAFLLSMFTGAIQVMLARSNAREIE